VAVKGNAISCEVCKYAMTYLDSMIEQNSTEEDVQHALDQLCGYLPSSMKSDVSRLVIPSCVISVWFLSNRYYHVGKLPKKLSEGVLSKIHSYRLLFRRFCPQGIVENRFTENSHSYVHINWIFNFNFQCISLVNQYSYTIIKLIVHELADPSTICRVGNFSSSSFSSVYFKSVK